MPDETTSTTTSTDEPTTPPEGTETTEGSAPEVEGTLSHEDALSALKETRAEAANTRVQLRDQKKLVEELQAALANAKSPEDFEAVKVEYNSKIETLTHELLIRDIAAEHKLPTELASALKGTTKDELEAHAKVLAKFIPAEQEAVPETLEGGLTPRADADALEGLTPRELAKKARGR